MHTQTKDKLTHTLIPKNHSPTLTHKINIYTYVKYTFQVSTNTAYYNQKWTAIRHSKAQLNRHRMTDGIQEQLNTTIEYIGFARELPMTSTKVCKSTLKSNENHRKHQICNKRTKICNMAPLDSKGILQDCHFAH